MAIRVATSFEPSGTVIKIDGRIDGEDVEGLAHLLEEVKRPASIDLTDLIFADRAGTAWLRGLISGGVTLRAASPYVQLLLQPES